MDKIVKLAAPKAKYIEPILQSTYHARTGEFDQVMSSLATRLKDSAWTVVYKALIVIHLMIREGRPNVTLDYLSHNARMLEIKVGAASNAQAVGLARYAKYIYTRAVQFKKISIDYVQERRDTSAFGGRDGGGRYGRDDPYERRNGPSSSSSSPSNGGSHVRLRDLSVEKGLLRQCESIIAQIDALLRCRFHEEDVNNDITLTVFRLLVHDLLSLYQVLNEGVINVLEHYFEMSKYDAEHALEVYNMFTKQTAKVVTFLKVAKNLEYMTKLHVPNIKHAPTSLTQSLEDYLNDPDFEINHRQYLAERQARTSNGNSSNSKPAGTGRGRSNDSPRPGLPDRTKSITNPQQPEPSFDPEPIPDFIGLFNGGQIAMQETTFDTPNPMAGQTNQMTGQMTGQMGMNNPMTGQMTGMNNPMAGQMTGQMAMNNSMTGQMTGQMSMNNPMTGQMGQPNLIPGQMTGGANPWGSATPVSSVPSAVATPLIRSNTGSMPSLQPLTSTPSGNPFRQNMTTSMEEPRNPFAKRASTLPVVLEGHLASQMTGQTPMYQQQQPQNSSGLQQTQSFSSLQPQNTQSPFQPIQPQQTQSFQPIQPQQTQSFQPLQPQNTQSYHPQHQTQSFQPSAQSTFQPQAQSSFQPVSLQRTGTNPFAKTGVNGNGAALLTQTTGGNPFRQSMFLPNNNNATPAPSTNAYQPTFGGLEKLSTIPVFPQQQYSR